MTQHSLTLRPLSCELSSLQSSDGSAIWKSGNTSILAAVHGPIAPRLTHHEDQRLSIVIKTGDTHSYEREWEVFIERILRDSVIVPPRTVLSIILHVQHDDGAVLAACVNAAVAALLDASIELSRLPTAVGICVSENKVTLDPTRHLETEGTGQLVVVLLLETSMVLGIFTSGALRIRKSELLECTEIASRAIPAIQAFWRLTMEQKVTRTNQTLGTTAD